MVSVAMQAIDLRGAFHALYSPQQVCEKVVRILLRVTISRPAGVTFATRCMDSLVKLSNVPSQLWRIAVVGAQSCSQSACHTIARACPWFVVRQDIEELRRGEQGLKDGPPIAPVRGILQTSSSGITQTGWPGTRDGGCCSSWALLCHTIPRLVTIGSRTLLTAALRPDSRRLFCDASHLLVLSRYLLGACSYIRFRQHIRWHCRSGGGLERSRNGRFGGRLLWLASLELRASLSFIWGLLRWQFASLRPSDSHSEMCKKCFPLMEILKKRSFRAVHTCRSKDFQQARLHTSL